MGPMNPPCASRGRLLLVPNTLDFHTDARLPLPSVLPAEVMVRAAGLRHWVVEDAKTARAFLQRLSEHAPLAAPLQSLDIRALPRPAKGGRPSAAGEAAVLAALLQPARDGHDLGLLSEAGMPAVADPGAALVAAAHREGLTVEALVGPSALLMALATSGLDGQRFAFVGYLPSEPAARARSLRELELQSRRARQTQIAIETPYRNEALWAAMLEHLQPDTRLALAQALTLPEGFSRMQTVARWRQAGTWPGLPRQPAVFCWLAG